MQFQDKANLDLRNTLEKIISSNIKRYQNKRDKFESALNDFQRSLCFEHFIANLYKDKQHLQISNEDILSLLQSFCQNNLLMQKFCFPILMTWFQFFIMVEGELQKRISQKLIYSFPSQKGQQEDSLKEIFLICLENKKIGLEKKILNELQKQNNFKRFLLQKIQFQKKSQVKSKIKPIPQTVNIMNRNKRELKQDKIVFIELIRKISTKIGKIQSIKSFQQVRQGLKEYIDEIMMSSEGNQKDMLGFNLKQVFMQILAFDISRNNCRIQSKSQNCIKQCFQIFKEFEFIQQAVISCDESDDNFEETFVEIQKLLYKGYINLWQWPIYNNDSLIGFLLRHATRQDRKQRSDRLIKALNQHPPNLEANILNPEYNPFLAEFAIRLPEKGNIAPLIKWLEKCIGNNNINLQKEVLTQKTYASLLRGIISGSKLNQLSQRDQGFSDYFIIFDCKSKVPERIKLQRTQVVDILEKIKNQGNYESQNYNHSLGKYSLNCTINRNEIRATFISGIQGGYKKNIQYSGILAYSNIFEFQDQFQKCSWKIIINTNLKERLLTPNESEILSKKILEVKNQNDKVVSIKIQQQQDEQYKMFEINCETLQVKRLAKNPNEINSTYKMKYGYLVFIPSHKKGIHIINEQQDYENEDNAYPQLGQEDKRGKQINLKIKFQYLGIFKDYFNYQSKYYQIDDQNNIFTVNNLDIQYFNYFTEVRIMKLAIQHLQQDKTLAKPKRFQVGKAIFGQVSRNLKLLVEKGNGKINLQYDEMKSQIVIKNIKDSQESQKYYECLVDYFSRKANDEVVKNSYMLHLTNDEQKYIKQVVPQQEIIDEKQGVILLHASKSKKDQYLQTLNIIDMRQQFTFSHLPAYQKLKQVREDFLKKIYLRQINIEDDPFIVQFQHRYYPEFTKQLLFFVQMIENGEGQQKQIRLKQQAPFFHIYQKQMMKVDTSINVSKLVDSIIIQYNSKLEKKVQNALKNISGQKQKQMFQCLKSNSLEYTLKIPLKILNELKNRLQILLLPKGANGLNAKVSYFLGKQQGYFIISISNQNKDQQKLFAALIDKFKNIYQNHLKLKDKIHQNYKTGQQFLKSFRGIKHFKGETKQIFSQFLSFIEEKVKEIVQNTNQQYLTLFDNAFIKFIQNSDFDNTFLSDLPSKASEQTNKKLNSLNIFEMFLDDFLQKITQKLKADKNSSKMNKIRLQVKQILAQTQKAFKQQKNFGPFLQNYFKSINIISRIYLGQQLPLTNHLSEFRKKLQNNDVVMVKVGTGSGKSTLIPPYLIGLGYKKVVVTQPRRLPCRQIYKRISQVFGKGICGYRVGDGSQDAFNRLIYMTDGLLKTQAIYNLDILNDIDVLMIDEIHERSANIDILLLLLFYYCSIKRRKIKIILCSATIDTRLGDLMKQAKLKIDTFEVETKKYPVREYPIQKGTIIQKIVQLAQNMKGDEQLLVFVPGIREVNDIVEILRRKFNRQAYPITANQNPIQQEKNLIIGSIFIATAIAETSLTFRNLKYVVDSRVSRFRTFNPKLELMETEQDFSSQSSIKQRKGRVGRTCPGQYYFLEYNFYDFKNNREHNPTELQKADLTPFIFEMLILVKDFNQTVSLFENLTSNRRQFNIKIQYSKRILKNLNILNSSGSLLRTAPNLLKFGNLGNPQHNYAIQLAQKSGCQTNVIYLVAFFMMGMNLSVEILKYVKKVNKVQGDIKAIYEFIAGIMKNINVSKVTNIRSLADQMTRNCQYLVKTGWFKTIVRIIFKVIELKKHLALSVPPSVDWTTIKKVLVSAYSNKIFFNQSIFGGNINQYEKLCEGSIFNFDIKVKEKTIYKVDRHSSYDMNNPPKYLLAFNCGISPQQQCLLSLCEQIDISMIQNEQIIVEIQGKECDNKYFLGTMPLSEETVFKEIDNQCRNKYNRIKIDNKYPKMRLTGQFSNISDAFQKIIDIKRKNKEIRINLRGFLEEAIQNRKKNKRSMLAVIDPEHTKSMFSRLTFEDYKNMFQTIKYTLKNNYGSQLQWKANIYDSYLKLQKIKNIHIEDVITKLKAFFRWFADSQTICKEQLKIRPRYIQQSKIKKDQIKKICQRINQIVDSSIDYYIIKGWAKGRGISKHPRTARMVAVCWVLTCMFDCIIKGGFIRDYVINAEENLPAGDLTKLLSVNPRNLFEEITNDTITPSDIDCQLSNKVLFDEDKFEKQMKKLGITVEINGRDGWRLHLIFDRDSPTGAFTADLIMPYTTVCQDSCDFDVNLLFVKKDNLNALGQKIPLQFDEPKRQIVQIEDIIKSCLEKKMRPLKSDIPAYRNTKFQKRGWKISKDFCTPTVYKQLFTKSSPVDPNKINQISPLFYQEMVVGLNAKIVRIQYLKNKAWDDAFEAAENFIISQLQSEKKKEDPKFIKGVDSNSKYLFHGSSEAGIEGIKKNGFDGRYFKPSGYYGRGAYFADVPTKSHQYAPADSKNQRRMFIVKVALGKQQQLKVAQNNKLGPGIGYHSIYGTAGAHREYIVERWGQAKPVYLITYIT